MTTARDKQQSVSIDTKTAMLVVIAVLQVWNTWLSNKTKEVVETVHVATNSMHDALMKAAKEAGNKEGRKELKQEEGIK